jgi:hypothetical protein
MRARHIITAIAIVFFSLPIALRVVGVQAHEFENHAFADAPRLSQGWDLFPQTTMFFTDRMPLREQTVKADRDISEKIFGTTPNYGAKPTDSARVLDGHDGWLFLGQSLDKVCARNREMSVQAATRRWTGLLRAIEATGKNAVLVVVPEKDAIYPEYLPHRFAARDCLPDREQFWRVLESVQDPRFVPMRETELEAKRREHVPVYLHKDTHWNKIGASYFTERVLDTVGGRVRLDRRDLKYGEKTYLGDLTVIEDKPQLDRQVDVTKLVRPRGAAKVPGSTLLIVDSFGLKSLDVLRPFFDDLVVSQWDAFNGSGRGRSAPDRALDIARSDTVVIETGERFYVTRAAVAGEMTAAIRALGGKVPPK